MNKTEFLEQLERLLWDISCQEREEALDFYRSYFEDAGEENEAQVIQELGSPGKVAAIIKADLEDGREGTGEEHGEYTESGYQDERFREDHVPEKAQERTGNSENTENTEDSRRSQQGSYTNYRYTGREHRHQKSGISWPLIIVIGLIGIVALPVFLGIGGGAFGLLAGLFLGIIGIVLGLFFGGIGCLVGGVAGIVHTLLYQLSQPATAMAAAGISLIALAIGIVCSLGFIWLVFKAFPVVFRWCVDTIQRIFHRGNEGGDRI